MPTPVITFDILLSILNEIETTTIIDQFIVNDIFDSDSQEFYNDATDDTQVTINELIYLLDKILSLKLQYNHTTDIEQLNNLGYIVNIVPNEVYFSSDYKNTYRATVKTKKCLITF